VWTHEQFEQHLARAEAMEARGPQGRNLARLLSAMSAEVEIDGQWRLTIPPNLREYAGLEPDQPVMVAGAFNRIELWKVSLWRERMAPSLESLADGTSDLFYDPSAPGAAPALAGAAGAVGAP
jgi:MraZ protein